MVSNSKHNPSKTAGEKQPLPGLWWDVKDNILTADFLHHKFVITVKEITDFYLSKLNDKRS